jgi:hypothetical protein
LPIWTDDNPFPVAIDFGIKDMLLTLRPKLKAYKTLQEAADAVENLEKELMNKLSQAVTIHTLWILNLKLTLVPLCFLDARIADGRGTCR